MADLWEPNVRGVAVQMHDADTRIALAKVAVAYQLGLARPKCGEECAYLAAYFVGHRLAAVRFGVEGDGIPQDLVDDEGGSRAVDDALEKIADDAFGVKQTGPVEPDETSITADVEENEEYRLDTHGTYR